MDQYAAHIRKINGTEEIQTVEEHCEETARRAEQYAAQLGLSNIAKLQGFLHDAGKFRKDFNDYIHEKNDIARGEIDHSYAGGKYLEQLAKETKSKKLKQTADLIARTIISHHGLHDWLDENGTDYYQQRIQKDECYEEIKKRTGAMLSEEEWMQLLQAAGEEYKEVYQRIGKLSDKKEKQIAFYMGQFERLMQSILVDADRTDTAGFQSGKETEVSFGKEIWQQLCDKIETKSAEFEERTDSIAKLRCDISRRCKQYAEQEVKICRLIVPTGGGKTLSSLRFALNYCKNFGKERIFYIAPYTSILEQNSAVFKKIVGEEFLLEHHSDVLAAMETEQELAEYELRSDKWDMPVIATTMVQFLNTFFSGRMDSVRRMHRLCNAVVIIDEVQSVPTKCVSLFNLAMNFLAEIGRSAIVLCSATQPTFEETSYPLKIEQNSSMTGDYSGDFLTFKRNEIVSEIRSGGYDYQEAADFCLEKYKEEGSVLFVVNTKTAALKIYQELTNKRIEGTEILHLSTSMCPENRRIAIEEMKKHLEKHKKLICVTTALIEAGVDISYPCVIRSLAGMDNAAQAAGRCNRNGEFERCCKTYLINLSEERLGNLKEIKVAQDVSREILGNERYKDIQSVETMSAYFRKYYMEQKEKLNYDVEDGGSITDLLELLSLNECRSMGKESSPYYCRQAFKTAGKKFQVIEDNTIAVIVPYNAEAKELMAKLYSNLSNEEMIKILRKAQKYTVGIYEQIERKLKEQEALQLLACGVYVLKEGYYDEKLGVMLEGKPMDFLMY